MPKGLAAAQTPGTKVDSSELRQKLAAFDAELGKRFKPLQEEAAKLARELETSVKKIKDDSIRAQARIASRR